MSVACVCTILDMAGHSRNTETIKLKEKIDFDYLVQSQPLIKLMDQIGFSFSPSIHDLLSLSLDHPHQFHVLVLKNCSVPVLCQCFLVFCHFSFLRGVVLLQISIFAVAILLQGPPMHPLVEARLIWV